MENLKNKSTNANLGNVVRMKLISIDDIIRIKNRNRLENGNVKIGFHILSDIPIRCSPGYKIFPISLPAGTSNYQEKDIDNFPNSGCIQSISTFLPDDSPELAHELYKYRAGRWVVIFEDSAGQVRLMGTLKTPVTYKSEFSTSGTKGRNIVFSSIAKRPAWHLEGYADAEIIAEGDDGLPDDFPV